MQKLTKKQALEILDNVTKIYKGTREEHLVIQLALQKLSELNEAVEETPKGE